MTKDDHRSLRLDLGSSCATSALGELDVNNDISDLYRRLIDGWNANDAAAMAEPMAPEALVIGFDGSQMVGKNEIESQLAQIFADHRTATYVAKVRSVQMLGVDAALLHAVVGMVPPDGDQIIPERNAVQTVVAAREAGKWRVMLFQTTPAQFHGRPDLSQALTSELAELHRRGK
jgi:uncharacterized protein (TIGR02246 family)